MLSRSKVDIFIVRIIACVTVRKGVKGVTPSQRVNRYELVPTSKIRDTTKELHLRSLQTQSKAGGMFRIRYVQRESQHTCHVSSTQSFPCYTTHLDNFPTFDDTTATQYQHYDFSRPTRAIVERTRYIWLQCPHFNLIPTSKDTQSPVQEHSQP